jgi:hypothetical protein
MISDGEYLKRFTKAAEAAAMTLGSETFTRIEGSPTEIAEMKWHFCGHEGMEWRKPTTEEKEKDPWLRGWLDGIPVCVNESLEPRQIVFQV